LLKKAGKIWRTKVKDSEKEVFQARFKEEKEKYVKLKEEYEANKKALREKN